MFYGVKLYAAPAALTLVMSGCHGQQAKVDALQKEYDRTEEQFRKDCNQEFLKVPPILSPKCVEEDKQTKKAWNRLQAERAKR